MNKTIKTTLAVVAGAVTLAGVATLPSIVSAWGDNSGLPDMRPSYTIEGINNGDLGPAGADAKNQPGYPGKIVFNSISNSTPIGGDEKNFVAARECVLQEDGSCYSEGKNNQWYGNDITVEDGKTYLIRIYAHNNNPNGVDAVAKDTKVWFNIPTTTADKVQVNGFINSSNANPTRYWDYVNFNSKDGTPFKLEYQYGQSKISNNGKVSGTILSDNIVQAKAAAEGSADGGVLIGYDALDGNVPGCYQYASYITIRVKAVYDYDYTVEKKVRLAGDTDRTWKDDVIAKVGDKVEFQIQYRNTSDKQQTSVAIKDILPSNLRYVPGSTKIMNSSHPNGANVTEDHLVNDGLLIGNYGPNANAFLMFTAEVVDNNLACGNNTLVNWAQAGVGQKTIQDYARVITHKVCENTPDPTPVTPELPKTGPEMVIGGVIAASSLATAAGYYIVSRRQLH